MARPKEKVSAAFQQKCQAATDKLRKIQAEKLSSDMERLFSEQILADMPVELLNSSVMLHSCVVKARSQDLYNYLVSQSGDCQGESHVSLVKYGRPTDLRNIFKALYTEDDITAILTNLEDIISEVDALVKYMAKADVRNNESVQNCLDVQTENEDQMTNGFTDLESKDEDLYKLAGQIVHKCIQDAKAVVKCDRPSCENNNADLDRNIELTEQVKNGTASELINMEQCEIVANSADSSLANSVDSEIVKTSNNGGTHERHCSNTRTAPVLQNDTVSTATPVKTVSFRRTGEECQATIQSLAERTLGVKMWFEPCSGLGEDLLRMLLEGETCDHGVMVQGQSFRVNRHKKKMILRPDSFYMSCLIRVCLILKRGLKEELGLDCILACRSSYFEAMLAGCWRESDVDQILLEGIDPGAMRQALLYLYGGVIEVDPSCTLGNLVMMSDMYSMERLKDVVAFNLNKEYCHFFHRPCSRCITGVPDTLALTMMYNMDTLREKCARWISKNLDKVWPTKTFASLPQEVLEYCISSAVKDLALDNVIDVMVECRKLNETTPRLRWSEPIFDMITQLMDAAIEYASQNFVPLVSSKNFRKLNEQGIAFNRGPLEDIFGQVITALSPENACQSYLSLNKWRTMVKPREEEQQTSLYSQEFYEFVEYLFKKCQDHLCTYIHQAANTVEWGLLTKDMQQELMKEANYVCIDSPNKSRMARPKLTSMQKKISTTSPLTLKEYFDRHFGSKEHIPKTTGASMKSQPRSTKGSSPIPSTGDSSKGRKQEPGSSAQDSSKVRKLGQTRTVGKATGAKSALHQTKSNANSVTKTQAKPTTQKHTGSVGNKTKVLTDSTKSSKTQKKSLLPRAKSPGRNVEKSEMASGGVEDEADDQNGNEDDATLSCELEIEPRARSNSASAGTFVSQFGQTMRSAQSMDSFFDPRQGHSCSIQRPLPVLEVKFIVPHEFYENF